MGVVENITELEARVAARDQSYVDHAAAVSLEHPEHAALDRRPLKLLHAANGVSCDDCGEPEFNVRDQTAGTDGNRCRGCINATRQLTLVHSHMIKQLCLRCEVTLDSYGLVNAANHGLVVNIEDFMLKGVVIAGLKTLIGQGLVEIDDLKDVCLIHTVVHAADHHCPGCKWLREPACPGRGVCDDCGEE
jgi:uncharacterized protein (DUF1778 family)